MNFVQAISTCFTKYATFSGRASRSEFWYFRLFFLCVIFGSSIFKNPIIDFLFVIFILTLIVPNIAVWTRRMHDRNKSGWVCLLGLIPIIGTIILFVWEVTAGTLGANRYGENPLKK